jgi:heat shock protein HslJ
MRPAATACPTRLAGCCRLAAAAATTGDAGDLGGSAWQLVDLPGSTPAALAALSRPVAVRFAEGRVSGFSGCNQFTGSYQREGDRLTLAEGASTMMACPEPVASIENAFQAAFAGALRYALEGDRLTLTSNSGAALRFERQPPPKLAGVEWKVTGYNNNRQAVVGVIGDPPITLSFKGGEVAGSAGCNTFRASYSVEGNGIRIGPAMTTRRACEEPLMVQEREFLAALVSAVTWSIDGNVLDMHRADGERAIWAVAQ